MVAMLLSLILFQTKWRPLHFWYGALALFAYITSYHFLSKAALEQFTLLSLGLGVVLQVSHLWGPRADKIWRVGMYVLAGLTIGWLTLNSLNIDPYFYLTGQKRAFIAAGLDGGRLRLNGPADHTIYTSTLLALCLPFVTNRIKLVILFAILMIGSTTGMLAAACILPFYMVEDLGKFGVALSASLLLGVAIMTYFFAPALWEPSERFIVWKQMWAYAFTDFHPFKGMGLGHFFDQGHRLFKSGEKFRHPHNEFISVIYNFGVIVGGMIVGHVGSKVVKGLRVFSPYALACLMVLVAGLTSFPLHVPPTACIFMVCFGTLIASKETANA
jgi:hypothetical protein